MRIKMTILQSIQTYIEDHYPCCSPVLKDEELLINQPHASISSTQAHKGWLHLEDKLKQKYVGINVERIRHQIHVTTR